MVGSLIAPGSVTSSSCFLLKSEQFYNSNSHLLAWIGVWWPASLLFFLLSFLSFLPSFFLRVL